MSVKWERFTPLAIEPSDTPSVTFEVKVDGGPTSVRLELASTGSEVPLRDDGVGVDSVAGDNIYTIKLSAPDIIAGYSPTDVNRKFVGYLRLYDGDAITLQRNVFIDVLTPDIPPVDVQVVAADLQCTTHLVNILAPVFFSDGPSVSDVPSITTRFYAGFGDDFDFINLVYATSHPENAGHFGTKTAEDGIGHDPTFDTTAEYGSAGRLLGITLFPIPTLFDAGSSHHNHELGHQWVNFLPVSPLDRGNPHWPLSDLAHGVMGWGKGTNTQGLRFPFRMASEGDVYRLRATEEPAEYSDLSLYLMGLLSPDRVSRHIVFDNQDQTPVAGGTLAGPVTEVTIGDVGAALGPRRPSHRKARKLFRVATIIVSEQGLLTKGAMRLYDHFAARGAATEILPHSLGLSKGRSKPFYLATRRLGRLDMVIKRRILIDASRDGGVWWFPQTEAFDETAPHQGRDLAQYLLTVNHRVTQLPRTTAPGVITDELLARHDLVIRVVGGGPYRPSEIAAYHQFVIDGGSLLLLADHGPPDQLALSFGLRFEGVNRGLPWLNRFTAHPIVEGVHLLRYRAGGGLTDFPDEAIIVGRLTTFSFLDVNENRWRDRGEPFGPPVLGVTSYGFGRIVFCGDANLWQAVPQPLVRNTLRWLGGG